MNLNSKYYKCDECNKINNFGYTPCLSTHQELICDSKIVSNFEEITKEEFMEFLNEL